MYNSKKLLAELSNFTIDMVNFDDNGMSIPTVPTAFIGDHDLIYVSGEDGKGLVDYYGEYRGGYPYINSKLEEWAGSNGCYWEWQNPGCIVLIKW